LSHFYMKWSYDNSENGKYFIVDKVHGILSKC